MVSNFLVTSVRGKPNYWSTSGGKEFTYRHWLSLNITEKILETALEYGFPGTVQRPGH